MTHHLVNLKNETNLKSGAIQRIRLAEDSFESIEFHKGYETGTEDRSGGRTVDNDSPVFRRVQYAAQQMSCLLVVFFIREQFQVLDYEILVCHERLAVLFHTCITIEYFAQFLFICSPHSVSDLLAQNQSCSRVLYPHIAGRTSDWQWALSNATAAIISLSHMLLLASNFELGSLVGICGDPVI